MARKASGNSRRTSSKRSTSASSGRTRQKDAITLLKEDHQKVRGLLKKLEKAALDNPRQSETLLEQIEKEIKVHSQIEEEIFYPAFKQAVSGDEELEKIFFEANDEHALVDHVLPQAKGERAGTPEFAAKAKVLKDLIEHHAEEEEDEMFPKARKAMGTERIKELGARMEQRKQQLMRAV